MPAIGSQRNSKTFIIAEAGVNHNGKLDLAKQMIQAAAQAGADAVKFQTFRTEKLVSAYAPKAEYQKRQTAKNETQFEMIKKLELDKASHKVLIDWCQQEGIQFLSSPFDIESIDLLQQMNLRTFKIPSGEITNLPYLRKIGGLNRRIILSTGMADLTDIGNAIDIIVSAGTPLGKITVLHCNTEYPTPISDVNLLAMLTIAKTFSVKVGYSDHTLGIEIPIAAVALGASIIEKHFTLDKSLPGPDHKASLEPDEMGVMVQAIRDIEMALGDGQKVPSASELVNRDIVRKSIVAGRNILKQETFSEENVSVKRPGTGISPMRWDEIIGKRAPKDFQKDELIIVDKDANETKNLRGDGIQS